MKNIVFKDITKDIAQKMDNCLFRYKGQPVWVRHAGSDQVALYNSMEPNGNNFATVAYNDKDLDFDSIPLGYVNYSPFKSVYYLKRIPVRKVRQGINDHNVRMSKLGSGMPGSVNNILRSKAFVDMVNSRYPTLEDSLIKLRKMVKENHENSFEPMIAISDRIGLVIDAQSIIRVFYKQQYVGWMEPQKNVVHVKSDDLGWVVSKYLSHILGWIID